MQLDLTGRVVLVTGAARGVGRAEALAFARRGARVVAVDLLDASDLVEQIERSGGIAVHARFDLAGGAAVARRVFELALSNYGEVHVLVNNAGVLRDRMSFNLSGADWELVIAVNLSASFYLAQVAARHWRERHAAGGPQPWVVVNTSSESGLYGNAGQANYAAAKSGIAAMTLTLAAELDRYGIRVNAIAPRARTPMSTAALGEIPTSDVHDPFAPEHVAEVVAWLVSDAAADVTGQVFVVHGGGVELMRPWSIRRRVERRDAWTDADLLGLRGELFPDDRTRQLAKPVSGLFAAPAELGREGR